MGSGLISPWHVAIVLLIALVVFGPKKLPELGKGLGRGMRDFKRGLDGTVDDEPAVMESSTETEQETPVG
jgi:sec-independent protein translocase protein TatA